MLPSLTRRRGVNPGAPNLSGSRLEAPSRSTSAQASRLPDGIPRRGVPLIREAQTTSGLGSWLGSWCCGADPLTVTGHKHLARLGGDFATIQWMARHSSQVTWAYMEMLFQKRLGRVQNAEIKFKEKLHHSALDVRHLDRVQFREEVRQSIIPFAVVISQSLRRCA